MTRRALLAVLAVLAGCNSEQKAAEQARDDAADVALVEAVQSATPPIAALVPQPITERELTNSGIEAAGCAFRPEGGSAVTAIALAERAVVKVDGDLHTFAADSGSSPLPIGIWTHYEGKSHVLDLQTAGGEGTTTAPGTKTVRWLGRLTIRDPFDRVVYSAAGSVSCGEKN